MKKYLLVVFLAVIAVGGFYVYSSKNGIALTEEVETIVVAEDDAPVLDQAVESAKLMLESPRSVEGSYAMTRTDLPEVLRLKPTDRYVGNPDAEVQIVEYASMTCGHCAEFNNGPLRQLKREEVARGDVFFIYRELPWDDLAMAVSKVARCAPEKKFFSFIDVFFQTQRQWVLSDNPVEEIKKLARLGGMDSETVEKCVEDKDIHQAIMQNRNGALNELKVEGTPALFINAEKVEGNREYSYIQQKIKEQIKKKKYIPQDGKK